MLLPTYMIDGGGDGIYQNTGINNNAIDLTSALQQFFTGSEQVASMKAKLAAQRVTDAKNAAEKARLEALAKQAEQAAAKAAALNAKYTQPGGVIVGGTTVSTGEPAVIDTKTVSKKRFQGDLLNDAEAEAIGALPPTVGTPIVTPDNTGGNNNLNGDGKDGNDGNNNNPPNGDGNNNNPPNGVDGFVTTNGILYNNGSPYTGEWDGKNYVNGKVVEAPGGDGFTTVNGVLMLKGKPYTGEYNGQNYIDGKVGTAAGSDYTTVDGVLMYKGAAFTGLYNGKNYKDGKVVTAGDGTNVDNPALAAVSEQVAALTAQIAELIKIQTDSAAKAAADAAKPKVVGVRTVRKTGGIVQTVEVMSDGSAGKVLEEYKDFGARDSVMKMFENLGLGKELIDSMVKAIDKVYEDNIMPTEDQVINAIYTSDAYNTRFAANKTIRERMASGKGLPGDRVLTPREYIETERTYKQYMESAGLPTDFYNELNDFTNLIANAISPDELKDRVNIAKNVLQTADENVKKALKDYYGLTDADMVAYLLDKDKAFRAIDKRFVYTTPEAQKMYTATEVGGAALRAGVAGGATKAFAEEITTAGKASQAEEAFQTTARNQQDYARLMGLYGEKAGQEDLTRQQLALAGGTEVALKTKKLASKERAKFSQRSAIDRTSLSRRLANPDV